MRNKFYIIVACCAVLFSATSIFAQITLDAQECSELIEKGLSYNEGMLYRQEYDTLRRYIELCASDANSWREFNPIGSSLLLMDTTTRRWVDGREWYKKVLYYNLDTNFYCADLRVLSITFRYFEGRGYDALGYLALLKYCRENNRCLSWLPNYDTEYVQTMNYVISTWRDSVKDSVKTPLDTTLPSLEELGLDLIRGQNKIVSMGQSNTMTIGDLSFVENPFHREAIIRYKLNHGAIVRLDVYDALGRKFAGEGEGYRHEGEHQISFDAYLWPSGVYYIRLSTMGGEVKTLKLVHEK